LRFSCSKGPSTHHDEVSAVLPTRKKKRVIHSRRQITVNRMPSKRGYKPVDRQSEALVRKNIIVRSVLVVLCAAILGIAIHLRILRNNVKDLDNLFSGTLIDDKGYYFPTTVDENRRSLTEAEADNDTLWSFDWTQDVDASAAVGVYYTAKGLALTNYYKAENVSTHMLHALLRLFLQCSSYLQALIRFWCHRDYQTGGLMIGKLMRSMGSS
jgi:hypothetical protein